MTRKGKTMNIQIFGTSKCFDTKKAQRYFKERGIRFQFVDLSKYSMSKGEFNSVLSCAKGNIEAVINPKAKNYDASFIKYLASEDAKKEKLFENQDLFVTPVVRNGKKATFGYQPETWKEWE